VPVAVLVIGTVLGGRDLGTVMILVLVVLGALFFAGIKLRMFIVPAVISLVVVLVSAFGSENRMARIASLFDPDDASCYYTSCYQSLHGVWGLASGGVLGLGLGNSKEKYDWLPAAANDYIFAIIGEELGLIGCLVVLVLFALFAVGAFHIIRRTDDAFVRIVAGAITLWIIGQAIVNIGVVLRIFPVLGVPLPFMSQGGTSLLSVLIACGVLLSCARTLPDRRPLETPPARAGRRRRA
jgi:cell division protein FtsW